MQSLEKDLDMGISTLESYVNGELDKYDSISGSAEFRQFLDTVDAPKDETLVKLLMEETSDGNGETGETGESGKSSKQWSGNSNERVSETVNETVN